MEGNVKPESDRDTQKSDRGQHLTPPTLRRTSPGPGPSCESLKSDSSNDLFINFKRRTSPGPGPSCESLKSDSSNDLFINFKRRTSPGPGPSCESLKSDSSNDLFINFKRRTSPGPGPSCESLKSDSSNDLFINFKREDVEPRGDTQRDLEEEVFSFLMNHEEQPDRGVLQDLSFVLEPWGSAVEEASADLRWHLQQKFSRVFEGWAKAGDSTPLTQIYTGLHITEGGAAGVNQEHEVISIENFSRKQAEATITCEDMFKGPPDSLRPRTVLTMGVAGIGKTVLTQKFSLDWAEGRTHQDFQLLFPFTFRELNVLRDSQFSLVELLHHFFSPSKDLCSLQQLQVLFIFDGLDECRLPLDFSRTRVLTDPTESASVHVLLVNLIRGSLLPSARLWITTRPAAANQIPAEWVSMVTEVRGFTDLQKEQYFRKRFRDGQQATDVISHIKTSRSLYILCHLPIFCWILSTVLQHLMKIRELHQLPHTITQMYVHFLVAQAKVKNIKYESRSEKDSPWTPETREMVKSLGKVAFEQLQKGNLIFYESDLSECGLDAAAASVYSGVFTQIFREERGLYQDKVYCFIHMSVQEFLAALHVHQTFFSSGVDLLSSPHSSESCDSEAAFYRSAVDQALQSPNGHLDLFLRFLLGLSLPTNQRLLQGLLTQTGSEQTNQKTVEYIKEKLSEYVSAERSLNLFHCLHELNDHSLVKEVQSFMSDGRLSHYTLSPAQWSAVSFLLCSDSDLGEFDLKQYRSSETGLLKLMPVVKASTKAILSSCNLTELSCASLASVLGSSSITHLDLSNNDLQDSGVELLCSGLKSAPCRLETLRLSGCLVSESGGAALASALSSSSHLREFDLSYNHPGASIKLLTALQDQRPLLSVRLNPAGERWMVPGLRKYSCDVALDPNTAHRRLLVSADRLTVTHEEEQEEEQCAEDEDRFFYWPQVLSSSGLMGRCYWEVQWRDWVDVAVTYRQRGDTEERRFGDSRESWSLRIKDKKFLACHDNTEILVMSNGSNMSNREGVFSGRVGVYLDSEAGSVSFYQVFINNKLSHLHTFNTAFSEPLFLGFHLWYPGSSVTVSR